MAELVDVDLDALIPGVKRVKLAGKVWKLPVDMPMELFMRVQGFEQRVARGEDETVLLAELTDELLALFKVHQPELKKLPEIGILTLLGALGAIYGGGGLGEAMTPTPPAKKKTPSKRSPRAQAT